MKILVAIIKPEAIRKILDHLGIPSETPRRTSARSPPQAELAGTPDLFEVDYADPAQPRVVTKWVPEGGARDRPCPLRHPSQKRARFLWV